MSGGQRIDDHSFWAGSRSKGSIFPEGAKTKQEMGCEGSGHLSNYEDTTEKIYDTQVMSKKKVSTYPHKPGTRN
jgi:hypothetical protein